MDSAPKTPRKDPASFQSRQSTLASKSSSVASGMVRQAQTQRPVEDRSAKTGEMQKVLPKEEKNFKREENIQVKKETDDGRKLPTATGPQPFLPMSDSLFKQHESAMALLKKREEESKVVKDAEDLKTKLKQARERKFWGSAVHKPQGPRPTPRLGMGLASLPAKPPQLLHQLPAKPPTALNQPAMPYATVQRPFLTLPDRRPRLNHLPYMAIPGIEDHGPQPFPPKGNLAEHRKFPKPLPRLQGLVGYDQSDTHQVPERLFPDPTSGMESGIFAPFPSQPSSRTQSSGGVQTRIPNLFNHPLPPLPSDEASGIFAAFPSDSSSKKQFAKGFYTPKSSSHTGTNSSGAPNWVAFSSQPSSSLTFGLPPPPAAAVNTPLKQDVTASSDENCAAFSFNPSPPSWLGAKQEPDAANQALQLRTPPQLFVPQRRAPQPAVQKRTKDAGHTGMQKVRSSVFEQMSDVPEQYINAIKFKQFKTVDLPALAGLYAPETTTKAVTYEMYNPNTSSSRFTDRMEGTMEAFMEQTPEQWSKNFNRYIAIIAAFHSKEYPTLAGDLLNYHELTINAANSGLWDWKTVILNCVYWQMERGWDKVSEWQMFKLHLVRK